MRTGLAGCLTEWPVAWEEVDASGGRNFEVQCRNRWAVVRADLEPRELDDALEQCEQAREAVDALSDDEEGCDQLRALYVD